MDRVRAVRADLVRLISNNLQVLTRPTPEFQSSLDIFADTVRTALNNSNDVSYGNVLCLIVKSSQTPPTYTNEVHA